VQVMYEPTLFLCDVNNNPLYFVRHSGNPPIFSICQKWG